MLFSDNRHYYWIYGIFALGLPVIIPVLFWEESIVRSFLICYVWRQGVVLHDTWFVNSAAHLLGDKPYDPKIIPVENTFVSMFTMGEGYHNFHHAFPFDYRAADFGFFNLNKWFLDTMEKLGLAEDLKKASTKMIKGMQIRNNIPMKSRRHLRFNLEWLWKSTYHANKLQTWKIVLLTVCLPVKTDHGYYILEYDSRTAHLSWSLPYKISLRRYLESHVVVTLDLFLGVLRHWRPCFYYFSTINQWFVGIDECSVLSDSDLGKEFGVGELSSRYQFVCPSRCKICQLSIEVDDVIDALALSLFVVFVDTLIKESNVCGVFRLILYRLLWKFVCQLKMMKTSSYGKTTRDDTNQTKAQKEEGHVWRWERIKKLLLYLTF